jgi:ParB family transcriptional regulator, chromosome partitioning protein
MSDTIAEPITLEAFDPAALLMDANARSNAEATVDKAFVASLKAHAATSPKFPVHGTPTQLAGCGNYGPVTIVRRPDGQLRVRAGHRRNIGCMRGGVYVLGFVAGDEGDERADLRARLIEQWNENHYREEMTVRDDTALLLALFDEGEMTEAGIARATGLSRPHVAASLTVARSETAVKAAGRWEFLTLDQAATLAEFESDPGALTSLVQAAKDSPGQFDHVVARLRATRAEREAKVAFTAELEAQGIAIYGDRPHVPWTLALENQRDGDGNEITPEAHATCPGRAVTITYEWAWAPGAEAAYRAAHDLADDDDIEFAGDEEAAREAGWAPRRQVGRYLCTDPEQYGHTNVLGPARETPTQEQKSAEDEAAEDARKTEERRRVRQRNTEWRAATEVRTSHLKALLARKAPPAGALKLIVEAMARGETQPLMSSFGHETACELLGLAGNGAATGHRDLLLAELARASEKRTQVIALAMVLGAAEHCVRDVHTWQSAEGAYWSAYSIPAAARYLAWLAEHTNYGLSSIEAEVAARATAGTGEPAGEAGPGPDEDEQERDSEDSNAYQDQAEAGETAEEDSRPAPALASPRPPADTPAPQEPPARPSLRAGARP